MKKENKFEVGDILRNSRLKQPPNRYLILRKYYDSLTQDSVFDYYELNSGHFSLRVVFSEDVYEKV